MPDEKALDAEVDAALRTGDPEAAVRVIMNARNCSLDAARKEVHERLMKSRKK